MWKCEEECVSEEIPRIKQPECWRDLPTDEEEREILEKIEKAEKVQVIDLAFERVVRHIDKDGRIKRGGKEDDFLIIKMDNEEFIYKTWGDDEWAYEVWLDVKTKITEIIKKRVEEIFGSVIWTRDCNFGCCLFFEKNGRQYRVRFGRHNFVETLHYRASLREYSLKVKDFTIQDRSGAILKVC